jgi:hypothetical protein
MRVRIPQELQFTHMVKMINCGINARINLTSLNVHTFTMREQRKRLNKIMLNGQNIDQDTHKLLKIATNNTRHTYQNGEQRKI